MTQCYNAQQQTHSLKAGTQVKSMEVKTLQKTLEQKDEEMKKLARHIATQEAQLQELLHSDVVQITDEHQVHKCIEILHDLEDSRKCLADAEEEHRVIAIKVTLLHTESRTEVCGLHTF